RQAHRLELTQRLIRTAGPWLFGGPPPFFDGKAAALAAAVRETLENRLRTHLEQLKKQSLYPECAEKR
ncbi:MAG: hypothetical protein ACLR2P_19050, partial [Bilophila wadsworthia]